MAKTKPMSAAQAMRSALAATGVDADNETLLGWIQTHCPGVKISAEYLAVAKSTARAAIRKASAPAKPAEPDALTGDAIAVKDFVAVKELRARMGAARVRAILDLLEG